MTLALKGEESARVSELLATLSLPLQAEGRLLEFLSQLQRWNSTYNLTAVRRREQMLTQHLADCLAILPALARQVSSGRVLDVGSGGGLPGVVIALLSPHLDVTCVDAVGKKAAFVRQMAHVLSLGNLHAVHGRVESLAAPPFDLIVSRAFATLKDFTSLTRHLLAANGHWLAMKGRSPDEERAALPDEVAVFHVEPLEVPGLDAERCLVWMRPAASLGSVAQGPI
jgi:16S rRNA (guanine527-N7)-methyltransferase